LVIWLWAGMALAACDWQPVARPVQPEQVLSGDYLVVRKLDEGERYVLLRSSESPTVFSIVDLRTQVACTLPAGTFVADIVLRPPTGSSLDDVPLFKLAVGVEGESGNELWLTDPDCKAEGPLSRLGGGPWSLAMDDDQRGVVLWGNGEGTLTLFDPWTGYRQEIAENVESFSQVARVTSNAGPVGPQSLWVVERTEDGAQLTMRTLSGTLLHAMGKNVTRYDQATFNTVRVAFQDGDDVYEASGDAFTPFLIERGACTPFYYGATLNMYWPCEEEQLVRFDLVTATIEEFPPGVRWSYTDSGVLLEYAKDGSDEALYATPSGGQRTRVMPTLYEVQVIDPQRLAGIAADRRFGVWSVSGGFAPLFNGVRNISPFIDVRSGNYVWLMLHEEKMGLGRLSVFDQESFVLSKLADDVPVKGYSVEYLEAVAEPIVVSIEDASPEQGVRGALRARLLSGELPSSVDDDVTSYEMIASPLPGLLYTVASGPKRGLWFAAL
jgi:hypothetical protein